MFCAAVVFRERLLFLFRHAPFFLTLLSAPRVDFVQHGRKPSGDDHTGPAGTPTRPPPSSPPPPVHTAASQHRRVSTGAVSVTSPTTGRTRQDGATPLSPGYSGSATGTPNPHAGVAAGNARSLFRKRRASLEQPIGKGGCTIVAALTGLCRANAAACTQAVIVTCL